jgi:hypothetical protein
VAAASLSLYGCAAHAVDVERGPRPAGHMVARPGRAGFVVAAPHGTSDPNTGHIAADIAARVGFGLVVATGFTIESGDDGRPVRRYQVNRPFEGLPGRGPAHDHASPAARRIYEEYEARVRAASDGSLGFYVEIHGNGRKDTAGRIEVATVAVDRDEAVALKRLLETARDAALGRCPDAPALDVLVEPADEIFYRAGAAKRDGILRLPERALHLELPRAARRDFREAYTEVLAVFVAQAAGLRPLR